MLNALLGGDVADAQSGDGASAAVEQLHPLCRRVARMKRTNAPDHCGVLQFFDVGTARQASEQEPLREGRWWDTADMLQLTDALPPGLTGAQFLLMGEVHDNPAHHAVRARLLIAREWLRGKEGFEPSAAVFEHIRADQQPALDRFAQFNATARRLGHGGDLMRFLEWDKSGWPAATMFEPLFRAVIGAKLAILPGDPARAKVRGLARGEAGAVPADEWARLRLDEPMPQPLLDALAAELKDSHCGMLPDAAIPGMALAQRYRDAHQADAMISAAEKHGSAVLFAGNGHVRADRGVPWYIRQRLPAAKVVSVMFIEVEDGRTDPLAYAPRAPDTTSAVDYVVFTPRAERPDPCEGMRSRKSGKG